MTSSKQAMADLVPLVRELYEKACEELDVAHDTSPLRAAGERVRAKRRLRIKYDAIMDLLPPVPRED